jgi:DnaJ-class molecular chaperone
MGKNDDNYPHPKKGEPVKCLACDGTGRIYIINRGVSRSRPCVACGGKGYFTA